MITAFLLLATIVLENAHSHNDYLRKRPLLDALDNGFCSVEADLFLVDGRLLVGHSLKELKPERTMESLYLAPLAKRLLENKGRIYPNYDKQFWVLVDIKTDGPAVYEAFKESLESYPTLQYQSTSSPVRFVISGDRPIELILRDKGRVAGLDGRWLDLDKGYSTELMPWVSEAWLYHFKWLGVGEFPDAKKLKEMTTKAHAQGRKVRFWGAPDVESIWSAQKQGGVDVINTDNLPSLRQWILGVNMLRN